MRFHRVSMPKPLTFRYWLIYSLALLTLACGILVESQIKVKEDGSSVSSLFIVMDKDSREIYAQQWAEQKAHITRLLEENGATVIPYSDDVYDGLEAQIEFSNLTSLNAMQSGNELSLFTEFSLRRWRGEFIFEAYTNGPFVRAQMEKISGVTSTELFLANMNIGLGLKLPGTVVYHDADEIRADNMLFWSVDWRSAQRYTMLARSRVALIPPVIVEPASGLRIRRGGSVEFAGSGEPGADIVLYRIKDDIRTPLAIGVIDEYGEWVLSNVEFVEQGEYSLIVEETTDTDTATSALLGISYRPLPPIVFVPGYYACTNGILNADITWYGSGAHTQLGEVNQNSLLDFTATGILPIADRLIYGPLFAYFDSQGYVLNETFFVACYNWAGSMAEEAAQVGQMITRAAETNTSGLPVTILTHSNGGLVSRYYIQAHPEQTISQIQSVIMIAPPNQGVARAYYAWEGGDIAQESTLIQWLLRAAFFLHPDPRCKVNDRDFSNDREAYQRSVYDCLHRDEPWASEADMPSVAWLVPDGSFLDGSGNADKYPDAPLESINDAVSYNRFFNGFRGSLYILTGTGIKTTERISIRSPQGGAKLWKNGKPSKNRADDMPTASGDGSVLEISTKLRNISENDRYHVKEFSNAEHTNGIIKRADVFEYIATILNEDFPPPPLPPTSSESNSLIIWVASPVSLLVTDPSGRGIGYDEGGNFSDDIPDAVFGETDDPLGPKFIIIPEALAGDYTFQITGLAEGNYELYGLSTISDDPLVAESGHIQPGEVKTFTEPYHPSSGVSTSISSRGLWFIFCGVIVVVAFIAFVVVQRRKRRRMKNDVPYDSYQDDFLLPPENGLGKKKRGWRRKRISEDGSDEYE